MKINIYQINSERDKNNVLYTGFKYLEKFQGTSEIDSAIYDKVFSGEVDDCKTLEDVYTLFNTKQINNYYGHSLSVSDIVEVVDDNSQIDKGFYFCDSISFKKVDFNPELTQDRTEEEKIKVVYVQEGKLAETISIENNLKSIQNLVGGNFELLMPFEDEVAIICNDEGKICGLPLNRAVYYEPENIELSYNEMKTLFRKSEKEGKHITGYVVFTEDSFDKPYSLDERTYVVSSDNKAFIEGMGGYSIFASSLDGSDLCVRIEKYMSAEQGGKNGWKVERCYIKDDNNKEIFEIITGDFLIAYTPSDSENFKSLPDNLAKKYLEKFKLPEKFYKINDKIEAIPYNPNDYYIKVSSAEAQILKDNDIPYCGKIIPDKLNIIKINLEDKAKVQNLLNAVRNKNNNNPKL